MFAVDRELELIRERETQGVFERLQQVASEPALPIPERTLYHGR